MWSSFSFYISFIHTFIKPSSLIVRIEVFPDHLLPHFHSGGSKGQSRSTLLTFTTEGNHRMENLLILEPSVCQFNFFQWMNTPERRREDIKRWEEKVGSIQANLTPFTYCKSKYPLLLLLLHTHTHKVGCVLLCVGRRYNGFPWLGFYPPFHFLPFLLMLYVAIQFIQL